MHPNLNLNWLRSFEAAARLSSFTAASHEIGLTQTAVSQHIKALETRLGDTLFLRRPRSLQLTDAGRAYLPKVREALDTISLATTGLFGPRQDSTLILRASMAFIIWLAPRLGAFQAAQPGIGIKLVTSIWKGPADRQPVDVDIVLAPHEHAGPELERLSDEALVPVVGATAASGIAGPGDLPGQKPIHILGFDDHWGRYLAAHDLAPDTSGARLVTDTSVAAMEMVEAGLGPTVMIERFARQAIATGRRLRIVGDPVALGQSHYVVRARTQARAQAGTGLFEEWLRQQMSHPGIQGHSGAFGGIRDGI